MEVAPDLTNMKCREYDSGVTFCLDTLYSRLSHTHTLFGMLISPTNDEKLQSDVNAE